MRTAGSISAKCHPNTPPMCARDMRRCAKSRSDRKSTRLNSRHLGITYAVFCLKKKWLGLLDEARGHRVADRLMQPDLFSGWGLRTLSSDHPAYDPFFFFLMMGRPPESTLFPSTSLFR